MHRLESHSRSGKLRELAPEAQWLPSPVIARIGDQDSEHHNRKEFPLSLDPRTAPSYESFVALISLSSFPAAAALPGLGCGTQDVFRMALSGTEFIRCHSGLTLFPQVPGEFVTVYVDTTVTTLGTHWQT